MTRFPDLKNPYHNPNQVSLHKVILTAHDKFRLIVRPIAQKHKLTLDEVLGNGRGRLKMQARYEAIDAVRNYFTLFSTTQIGRFFNRDHSTILASFRRIEQLKEMGNWPPVLPKEYKNYYPKKPVDESK